MTLDDNFTTKEIKPADPLLKRKKNIPLNPPIFSREGSYIILRPFNHEYIYHQEFKLKPKQNLDIINKDIMINLYINTMKTVQRLLYYKEPIVNESRITFDNIVNLRKIRPKKNMINSKLENKKIFK